MNALVQVLLQILPESFSGNHNAELRLLDYKDPGVFEDLWLQELVLGSPDSVWRSHDESDEPRGLAIIGNDPPDGIFNTKIPALAGINFRGHFTATSWLAAWRLRFPDSRVRIAVIDPREASLASGAARALQTILSARNATGQPLVPGATVLNAPSLEAICQWIASAKTHERTLVREAPQLRDLIKSTIWNELTSNREQHHALSNVLGAFLLSTQVGNGVAHPGAPWIQDYLVSLVNACGFTAHTQQVALRGEEEASQPHQVWVTPEQQDRIPGAVLVDDMAELWSRFVAGALGFYGPKSNRFATLGKTNFSTAIQALPERLAAHFNSRAAYLGAEALLGAGTSMGDDYVLLLDLRLFSHTSGQTGAAEVAFFANLADFGLRLLDSRRNLPWLNQDTKKAMRLELESLKEPSTSTTGCLSLPPAETLLPRLLSLLDPTLPIVIFSSTQRAELIEPFRDYGNIITGFHKPVLGGLSGGWDLAVREMHRDFLDVMDRAAAILRVRALLRPLQKPKLQN
jgi:hypothetical protein